MNRVPMTAQGAAALQAELEELKKVTRPKIVAAIAEAREHGDLKENAEYHAAREQQGFVEGRIQDIEAKLSNAQVIDVKTITNNGKVIFGATVILINLDDSKADEVQYQIVGDDEANLKEGKISINSPIARGLIGKEEGDIANIQTPGGTVEYEIAEVLYL
ncbi:MAG: transcription elongation factor GreA [Kangiellaceae bacterium]|nr:transcription elongation factor GreA [Kangiellaceae bacterium]